MTDTPRTDAEDEPQLDVPGVPWCYYSPIYDNFYERESRKSLGYVFYQGNIHRMKGKTAWSM